MSYKVQSRTTLEQYKKKENEVIRRFRDFAWLHSKLQEQNRGKQTHHYNGSFTFQNLSLIVQPRVGSTHCPRQTQMSDLVQE